MDWGHGCAARPWDRPDGPGACANDARTDDGGFCPSGRGPNRRVERQHLRREMVGGAGARDVDKRWLVGAQNLGEAEI